MLLHSRRDRFFSFSFVCSSWTNCQKEFSCVVSCCFVSLKNSRLTSICSFPLFLHCSENCLCSLAVKRYVMSLPSSVSRFRACCMFTDATYQLFCEVADLQQELCDFCDKTLCLLTGITAPNGETKATGQFSDVDALGDLFGATPAAAPGVCQFLIFLIFLKL